MVHPGSGIQSGEQFLRFHVQAHSVRKDMVFSGIVQAVGSVSLMERKSDIKLWDGSRGEGYELEVRCENFFADERTYEGCSVAVNGTCLTVMTWTKHTAVFGVAPETLKRTNLDVVSKGDPVNLEHSLKMNAPNSGHYVQGHVDGTGTLANTWRENESLWVRISCSTKMIRGIVPKGYVAIDGTSLTVVEVGDSGGRSRHPGDKGGTESSEAFFTFMLVSHTQKHIALPRKKLGSPINIELDVMGKYADRAIAARIVKMENRICQLERVIKGEGVSSMITLGTLSALAVCIVALAKLR